MVLADITIDLSTAEQDPATGQFCVVQKVKIILVIVMVAMIVMIVMILMIVMIARIFF